MKLLWFYPSPRDRLALTDKRPGAISRRRLALKLSVTAGIHFGERSRTLSRGSQRHSPRRHLLIGVFMRGLHQASSLTFSFVRDAIDDERVYLTDMHLRRALPFTTLGTCLERHSTDRTLLRDGTDSVVQFRSNWIHNSDHCGGKGLRTARCACRICIHA